MYNFQNDYAEGAHPQILKKLLATNLVQQNGYGEDEYSLEAKKLLKQKLNNPEAEIYFVSGGTQANLMVISSLLKNHEAAISARSGHIFGHEAGAIENHGHRVITVDSKDGKLYPEAIQKVLDEYFMRPHMVKPKLIYISNSTEIGTIYSKKELKELYKFCQEKDLLLFMDGARLGSALTAQANDVQLEDCTKLTDVFYIGGTKNGALLGEAIVINRPQVCPEFDYAVKQKGALLAKGRILGIQFLELFRDDLFFELALNANQMAAKLKTAFEKSGYNFLTDSPSNQIFPILSEKEIVQLGHKYVFHKWEKVDDEHSAIRLITSWATKEEVVDHLIMDLHALS